MVFFRFTQICVYVVLILLGYVLYRNFAKSDGTVNLWFDKIGFTKKWLRETIVIVIALAYFFVFYYVTDKIEVIYVDTSTNTIHLYEDCENINHHRKKQTFLFIAEYEGCDVCEDCLDEREFRLEDAKERQDELRYP